LENYFVRKSRIINQIEAYCGAHLFYSRGKTTYDTGAPFEGTVTQLHWSDATATLSGDKTR
jgi:hypothetical protein